MPGNAPNVALLTLSGATRSGFVRPSSVGPRELNDSMVEGESQGTAPTVSTPALSPGSRILPDLTQYWRPPLSPFSVQPEMLNGPAPRSVETMPM